MPQRIIQYASYSSSLLVSSSKTRLLSWSKVVPLFMASFVPVCKALSPSSFDDHGPVHLEKSPSDNAPKKAAEAASFDATREWNKAVEAIQSQLKQLATEDRGISVLKKQVEKSLSDFLSQIVGRSGADCNTDKNLSNNGFKSFQQHYKVYADLAKILSGKESEDIVKDIIFNVREQLKQVRDHDDNDFDEIYEMIQSHKNDLEEVMNKYMKEIDFTRLDPTALFYYMEYEDERKNPSWKRRMHRFCSPIDLDVLEGMHQAINIAKLCHVQSAEALRQSLESFPVSYELVYADVTSLPARPAHFVAIKRNQLMQSDILEVLIGVRGTKSVADAITDLKCDTEQYKDGKAHAYILKSGKYLVQKHTTLLEELLEKHEKSKINITLVGHSLGAGAASIAGMEWNDDPRFEVEVVGFGCPAVVSKELAEASTYITSVVNDWDVVPRLSGISAVNLFLDIMDYDWHSYAKRDIRALLEEIQRRHSSIPKEVVDQVMTYVGDILRFTLLQKPTNTQQKGRLEPELFPPGRCIHLYNDELELKAVYVPNDFFREIDVNRRMFVGTSTVCLTTA